MKGLFVWIDADVLINTKHSYDIIENVPIDKVGAVDAYAIPTREIFSIGIIRLYKQWRDNGIKYVDNLQPAQYYTNRGIPGEHLETVIQAGVFVCSPKHHKEIFEFVYYNYEDNKGPEYNYENPVLSYELLNADKIYWLSNRFNFCVAEIMCAFYPESIYKPQLSKGIFSRIKNKIKRIIIADKVNAKEIAILENIYDLSIFMHFAGSSHLMKLMKNKIKND
jgi:hypothetical protein